MLVASLQRPCGAVGHIKHCRSTPVATHPQAAMAPISPRFSVGRNLHGSSLGSADSFTSASAVILSAPRTRHRRQQGANVVVNQSPAMRTESEIYTKTASKALAINLNPLHYGVLAEIGAGQEVARWFFRVGGAAGTIAKSISAYDMAISDTTYGACKRYVTRERLQAMLDFEYLQCDLTLRNARGDNTAFFTFADTVVAKAFNRDNECHGWLGIKYQSSPRQPANQVLIHVRMLEKTAQAQAEALGILGVNLVHGALTRSGNHYDIIEGLMDDLDRARVEVDVADFSGPDFKHVDNRFAALTLVQKGLCDAALFTPSGVMQIPQETLYKKNVLVVRGRFRPFTLLHNDMLLGAASQFFCDDGSQGPTDSYEECVFRDDTLVLLEMTTRDMMEGGDLLDWTSDKGIQEDLFIQRIDALATMGYTVLLSSYRRYFKLAGYLSTFTNESIVIGMGVPSLKELFNERHYKDLEGGILEGFGRLLKFDLKIYVYPTLDAKTGELVTADTLKVDPAVQLLYDYIRQRGTLIPITDYNRDLLMHQDITRVVAESIRTGTPLWESLVPHHVATEIKDKNLLGHRPRPQQLPQQQINSSSSSSSNGAARSAASIAGASSPRPGSGAAASSGK